jgi:membrane protein
MKFIAFLKSLFARFVRDQTTTYAASVAFYTALSLAPILILFITLTSAMSPEFQDAFQYQVLALVGPDAAEAVRLIITNAKARPDLASWSGLVGVMTLLLSASLIFGELREAMNRIFQTFTPARDDETAFEFLKNFLRDRLFHIGMALSFLFIMIVSLIFSSLLSATFRSDTAVWKVVNVVTSFVFYAFVFALVFRYLPNCRTRWRPSLKGGFLTAFLFVVGKELIGLYLGKSAIGSAYGAAGSIIVLLAWVYYSAVITFIGAHVSALLPTKKAEAHPV